MPLRKQVSSLKEACLSNIARHMDSVWAEDYVKNFLDQGPFLQIVGPFEYLPSHLVHALLRTLSDLKLLKRHHLHLLLNPNLKKLDLEALRPVSNTNAIVRMVNQRCSVLTALNLATCKQVSAQVLCEVAESFPHLISLDLSLTKCSDQVLTILSHRCYKLRELKLNNCPVTDNGMVNLCSTFPGDRQKCPVLSRLEVAYSMVGVKGLKEALVSLPGLQWLKHPSTCLALWELHRGQDLESIPQEKLYKLTSLELLGQDLPDADQYVATACAFCPKASTVMILCPLRLVADSLSALTELHTLHLLDEGDEDFEDIVPLLQVQGSNLTCLNLTGFQQMDLDLLGSLCPNLQQLAVLYHIDVGTFVDDSHPELVKKTYMSDQRFSKLQELKLISYAGCNIIPSQLTSVLTRCVSLKVLTMMCIDALNDEVLDSVLQVNPLCQLERVKLVLCNAISGDAMYALLQLDNALTELQLFRCREITLAHYNSYRQVVDKNKYIMTVEWE